MRKRAHIAACILVLALVAQNATSLSISASTPARVRLDPASIQIARMAVFTIRVRIDNVTDMRGANVNLSFDPSRLRLDFILPGDLFPVGESVTHYSIDNETGELTYAVTLLGQRPAINGSGVLYLIQGQAIELGDARLAISRADLADSQILLIPVTTSSAVVAVGSGRAYLPALGTGPASASSRVPMLSAR